MHYKRTVKEQCIWHCISGKVKTTARNCHFLDTGHWPSKSKAQLPELQIKTFTRQIFWWENVPDTLFLVIPTRQKSPLLKVHFSSPSRRFAKLMFFSWRLSEKRMALTKITPNLAPTFCRTFTTEMNGLFPWDTDTFMTINPCWLLFFMIWLVLDAIK